MNSLPIQPVAAALDAEGTPYSELYQSVYHSAQGALTHARQVFLRGNGLPQRWQSAARFTVLEAGFGLGLNFLATWQAWRDDAARCARLHYLAVEMHPFRAADLRLALQRSAGAEIEALAEQLLAQWPPLSAGVQRLVFEQGRLELLLMLGDATQALRQATAVADAIYLDGFSPARNPEMWSAPLFAQLARLSRPGTTAATWCTLPAVRDGLAAAGFKVQSGAGPQPTHDITQAHYAPHHTAGFMPPWAGPFTAAGDAQALVIGAGLAGCATAAALAEQGWHCTLIEAREAPAQAASGNAMGVFHGVVHGRDTPHARLARAAARELDALLSRSASAEDLRALQHTRGLLRLSSGEAAAVMQARLDALGLPHELVHAVDSHQASRMAGITLSLAAWHYPGGGALSPPALCAWLLRNATGQLAPLYGRTVARLQRVAGGWQALDAAGCCIATAPVVVLADARAAQRLAGLKRWPLQPARGQAERVPAPALPLAVPLAGHGYALRAADGVLHFGASSALGSDQEAVRGTDRDANLQRVRELLGNALPWVTPGDVQSRAALRWVSRDRLPLIGALPDEAAALHALRAEQPRFVPRLPGLYAYTGLGSRGIAWSVYGARVLASWVSGAPFTLEAALRDALDPARFAARARRGESGGKNL